MTTPSPLIWRSGSASVNNSGHLFASPQTYAIEQNLNRDNLFSQGSSYYVRACLHGGGGPPGWWGNPLRWGNPPRRVARSARPVTILKVTIESHSTEGCSKNSKISEWRRALMAKTRGASVFLLCMLSDHSIILRKCTPGWQGCKTACKGELFCYPT